MKTIEKAPDFRHDPHLNTITKKYLEILNSGGVPVESLSKEEARKVLENVQSSVKVNVSGIEETEKMISADDYNIKLNVVRPKGIKEKLPVFVFIHGGGWILGDYPTHRRMVRDLVVESGYAAVFVNYTPSPEAKYPQAVNEIYAAVKWIASNGNTLNVDSKRLAVIGNSVGGNMSAVMGLMAKNKKGPAIKLMVMLWPVTDVDFNTNSYKMYGEQRFLTTSLMKWMFDQYTTDKKLRKEIYHSPLQASVDELKGLPPTLIITAENDILRDEGEAFGRKLDEAGVQVTTVRYNGVIHDFGLLNGFAVMPETQSMFTFVAAELKKYLK
ncbi:MAG: alpha/beta hydrolase [Tannerella sp.]|jgi:acetyl esterase/lipase|nr:alpha/beta hydrolase [Tannerella sp.]